MTIRWGILGILLAWLCPWWVPADANTGMNARTALLEAPLRFEPNRGQSDPQVRFLARGTGYGLFLTDEETVLRFDRAAAKGQSAREPQALRLRFEGARPMPARGRLRQGGHSHYLTLDDSRAPIVDVPHYAEVVQRGRYPGIDVVWYGTDGDELEYDFVLAPGADPAQIVLRFDGADQVRVAENGDLHLAFAGRTLVQRAPVAFQYADSASLARDPSRLRHTGDPREPVAAAYRVDADGRVLLEIGAYDPTRPLVIDPVINYATYLGGGNESAYWDYITDVAANAAHEAFVSGFTTSAEFPAVGGITPYGGGYEGYVAHFNNAGTGLVSTTFIGGNARAQYARGIVLTAASEAIVVGDTELEGGNVQGYILKLNAAGNAVVWSNVFGGSSGEVANALAFDFSGNLVVVGETGSSDFPVLAALQGSPGGAGDAFVRRYSAAGTLLSSSYLGGALRQAANAVAVDANGIYIAGLGGTASNIYDAFVIKLGINASTLVYSRVFGGSAWDEVYAVAVDANGRALAVGATESANFPLANQLDGTHNGFYDSFLAIVNSAGSGFDSIGYLPGTSGYEKATDILFDSSGNTWISAVGQHQGMDLFQLPPTASAIQATYRVPGFGDRIRLHWRSPYLYAAGDNSGSTALGSTPGAYQPALRGSQDGVLVRIDLASPQVSISGASCPEGDSGTTPCTATLTLSGPVMQPVSVLVTTSDVSAVAGSDYNTIVQTVSWSPGDPLARTVQVPIRGDYLIEGSEQFLVNLGSPSGLAIANGSAIMTIADNDVAGAVQLTTNAFSVGESAGPAAVTITRTGLGAGASVRLTTSDGGAIAGVDYGYVSEVVTFAGGQASASVSIPITPDNVREADENIGLTLSDFGGGASMGSPRVGLLTIVDDDPVPVLSVQPAGCSVNEGNSGTVPCTFTVTLSNPIQALVSMDARTVHGTTSAADLLGFDGADVFIAAGSTSVQVPVQVNGDLLDEGDETFSLQVYNVSDGVTTGNLQAAGTIVDDDPAPTLSIDNGGCTVTEGDSGSVNCVFVARLSAPSSFAVTFNTATANGTATAGSDYTGHASTARSIPAGQTSLTIAVPVLADLLDEIDETFTLNVSGVANATPGSLSATGTILDNDPTPTLSVDNGGCTVTEGNSGSVNCNFVARLSAPSSVAVTFNSATANGSATAGSDYTGHASTARSIAAGQTTLTIAVPVLGDTLDEDNETFALNITNVSLALPASLSATGTINDDDNPPTLSVDNGGCTVAEGNSGSSNCNFVVRLSAPGSVAVTFNSATANGTATAGADYTSHASTARSIAAGQTTLTIAVPVLGDTLDEDNETFALNLSGIANATPGSLTATGTISDDDATPTLSIDNGGCSVTEGNSGSVNCSFVARLSAVSGRNVSFTTATANGSATAGSDYTAHSAVTRTLAAGNQTLTVLVPVLGDTLDEPNETFALNFTAVTNATPGTLAGTGTIVDDDDPVTPGSLRVRDAALLVGENSGSVQVVVERIGGSTGAASVQYATANGTAIAGLDYGAASGTLNWAAGDASLKTVTLTIIFDPAAEPQESFTLNLSQASGATLGTPATTTVTIVDGTQMVHASGFE